MKPICLIILLNLFMAGRICSQSSAATRYIKVPEGYLMVLQQGDTILSQLKSFAKKENIPSANFTGMGFAEVTFGFFNFKTKKYRPKHFKAGELAAMHGTIAWQNDSVSIHTHGVITTKKFKAYGGHILSAVVGKGTLEIMIVVHDKRLERKKDAVLGANILCLDNCKP